KSRDQPDPQEAALQFGIGGRGRVNRTLPWRRSALHEGLSGISYDSAVDQRGQGLTDRSAPQPSQERTAKDPRPAGIPNEPLKPQALSRVIAGTPRAHN